MASNSGQRILVVEDEEDLARLLAMHLRSARYEVDLAGDGQTARRLLGGRRYQLVILDLSLPGVDGTGICRRLRMRRPRPHILVMTCRYTEIERALGEGAYADDMLVKPFRLGHLLTRVDAILSIGPSRRTSGLMQFGDLAIDTALRSVTVAGHTVDLSPTEFDLLAVLASHPGKAFTRTELLGRLWGGLHVGSEYMVNIHINRLRSKIERNPSRPEYIRRAAESGYLFERPNPGPPV